MIHEIQIGDTVVVDSDPARRGTVIDYYCQDDGSDALLIKMGDEDFPYHKSRLKKVGSNDSLRIGNSAN